MLPPPHHGHWKGTNRLWFDQPSAETSAGTLLVAANRIDYNWEFRGEAQQGRIELFGVNGALRLAWQDSWHARDGMALYGRFRDGLLTAHGTYAVEEIEWGWLLEVDLRFPHEVELRMFNLMPEQPAAPAVQLCGARVD